MSEADKNIISDLMTVVDLTERPEVDPDKAREYYDHQLGEITEEANEVVTAKRNTHGDAYRNHKQIAALWSDFLGTVIKPWEVAIMMVLMKASRMQEGELVKDHFRDVAGYAEVGYDAAVLDPAVPIDREEDDE